MEMYEGYHLVGMHLFWWFVWLFFIFWIFPTSYRIPIERSKKGTPLETLITRLASGQIEKEDYLEKKALPIRLKSIDPNDSPSYKNNSLIF